MHHPHLFGSFYGIGYPPTWGLILGLMHQVSTFINPNNIYTFILSLKLPIIASDMVTSFITYKIIKQKLNRQIAFKAFSLYQLCPFIIIIGSIWGMFDVVVFLLSLLSAYYLLEKKEWSIISLAFACSLKPYPIVLAPLFSIFIYKQTNSLKNGFIYSLSVTGLLSLITLIPMVMFQWPLSNLYHALVSHMSSTNLYYNGEANYTYAAASPFNIYNVFKLVDPSISPPWILNYLWIIFIGIAYYFALCRISGVNFTSIINWSFLTNLTFFSTRFWISEQNLIQLFSFFLLVVLLNRIHFGWKHIHTLWILFFTFVLIHVPANAFNWIVAPQTLNMAIAFSDGPLRYIRWISMSGLTFSWLGLLWFHSFKRMVWR
jgi:Gpi18-like mannosyltransferase